jgi:hypothetical protein
VKHVIRSQLQGPWRLAQPGSYKGSYISLDVNSLYPYCISIVDPPTGPPRIENGVYVFDHIHKPEIVDYFNRWYEIKRTAATPEERLDAKLHMNSIYGYILKKPK